MKMRLARLLCLRHGKLCKEFPVGREIQIKPLDIQQCCTRGPSSAFGRTLSEYFVFGGCAHSATPSLRPST
jgi:hypothetical protein